MNRDQWAIIFDEILSDGLKRGPLKWGLPEQWIHAELFASIDRKSHVTNWFAVPTEVPYFTIG